ncbi:hypothetical protein CR513_04111, partial [Mucuna pruriens]
MILYFFQEDFHKEIIFHPTYLSCALKDYFSLLIQVKPIKTILQLLCKSFGQKEVSQVHILHKRANKDTSKFIVDKAKQLSFVDFVTLIKSMLQVLLIYLMHSSMLPRFIYNIIGKKCKNFIWEDTY